ncbi:hypothetical protein R3W88_026972 [Solanum pinnatisectum]|uniref:Alliinase C-terminal domain-containing protein n=1 Tax=Solanum pinnatisectum TaxID=50273 RepID=A0AAV9LFI7_9SOLN|nr:hypothetical protein R3W88_026972 [Solanum pinnatisectum]
MCGTNGCLIKGSLVPCATPKNDTKDTFTTINLDHGDPTMYESYWSKMGNMCDITFNGDNSLSYFANDKSLCWFLESKLEEQIKRLHNVVGNAIVDDHYIVVGTGSSQLIQAAHFALSPIDQLESINVVLATPFYSAYPEVIDLVRLGVHKWAGDARTFKKKGPYIEFLTSPNNHDGVIREPVVNGDQEKLIYDLAYYLPQYTAITSLANHDVMLFTISKCNGHAGSRNEAQLRAPKILEVICGTCLDPKMENFFDYIVMANDLFVLQKYPLQYCLFTKYFYESHPDNYYNEDCEKLLKEHMIHTRSGSRFGSDSRNVRISMLSRDEDFNIFLKSLMAIQGPTNGN